MSELPRVVQGADVSGFDPESLKGSASWSGSGRLRELHWLISRLAQGSIRPRSAEMFRTLRGGVWSALKADVAAQESG